MAGRDTSIVDGPAPSSSSNEEDETSSSEGTTSTQVAATQPPQTDPGAVEGTQADSDWDIDSTLGFDTQSYTTSLPDSVLNYEYENGRRYHSYRSGTYPLPNDEDEQDRLDMQHHIYTLMLGGELYTAPIGANPQRILDIGTGTGIWAIDMADKFPSAEIIATDLSVIQPQWVPPNLRFEIDDCELDWTYMSKFDYIHIRSMSGSIGDWAILMEKAYDNLHPGGWIELMDFETKATTDDDSVPSDSAWTQYQTNLNEAASRFGKVMNAAPHYKGYVLDAGFANVTEFIHKVSGALLSEMVVLKGQVPFSPWPSDARGKELGRWMVPQMLASVEPYALALLSRVLKWNNTEIQVLLAGVRNDIRNVNYHLYSKVHVVFGQKPFA